MKHCETFFMIKNSKTTTFPKSRVATLDICDIGVRKHYISSFLEVDVTDARLKLKQRRVEGEKNSFTAFLLYVIAQTLSEHPHIAAFLKNKREVIHFHDINISVIIEKQISREKVPIPHIIGKAQTKTISQITSEIQEVKNKELGVDDLVLHRKTSFSERIYTYLPKWIRILFWKMVLRNPKLSYLKMGNVAFTSLGMVGKISGWFTPITIHPVCFGVGSIVVKPKLYKGEIQEREILHLTILMDHDVVDGAPMARFINDLIRRIENFGI